MVKKKKAYESPDVKVTCVELESSICTGSMAVEVKSPASTTKQNVNTTFGGLNDFGSGEWSDIAPEDLP